MERVVLKYEPFIQAFPDVWSLARAPLRDIMAAWQGLGYNRRALALQRIARRLVAEFDGSLPDSVDTLRTFPGIGESTAGALVLALSRLQDRDFPAPSAPEQAAAASEMNMPTSQPMNTAM